MEFKLPPVLHNEQGKIRTVGFELEYANLGIAESVQILQDLYGGTVEKEGRFKHKVTGTSLGDFTVEFDLTLLTEKGYRKFLDPFNIKLEEIAFGSGTLEETVEDAMEKVIGKIFPYEIACPPVPITELHQLEKLRAALHEQKAEGTEAFPTNAFGTHINVEAPELNCSTLLWYLRAFILLYPWLLEEGKTDIARKISPFIAPYPAPYAELILNPDYKPEMEQFIADYHTHNPDRNRPVDMYPLFASLKNNLIENYTGLGKVKPRNTFHYRLPNSSVALPDWTLAKEWNLWIEIEELANNSAKIEQLSHEYLLLKADTLIGFEGKWCKKIKEWVYSGADKK